MSCTYLAHHELESVVIIIVIIIRSIYCILHCTGSKLAVSSAVRDCMSAMQVSQHGIAQHTQHIKRLMFLRILHMTRKTVPRRRITSKGCESGTWLTGKL